MPPRTLSSFAHALSVASDLDAALLSLAEALADVDRLAHIALLRFDERRQMIVDRLSPGDGIVTRAQVETTFDHLPNTIRLPVASGAQFVDLGDQSAQFARLLGLPGIPDGGALALRGVKFDGALAAMVALHEPKKIFGSRTSERFAPAVGLFELAYTRFAERDARFEAVNTLEEVTRRVHGEYLKRLQALQGELGAMRGRKESAVDAARLVELERELARVSEEHRRARRHADEVDKQAMLATGALEQAHIELHRRSETLRQKTRTIYLIERVLTMDQSTGDPKKLVDGLLNLVGTDMQAQRCSLMLVTPEGTHLYLAAARGLAPNVADGMRVALGEGVAGKVAASRQPLLVRDVSEATTHPLLRDQYFTTGSFISFPLVYHGELVGVVNLTNRALHGVFLEEDVERVRLLALLISLVAYQARLAERLHGAIAVR